MQLLLSGSVAYDQIMNFPGTFKENILPDKIHQLNVSFFINQLEESFGGIASNIGYTLSLFGQKPELVCNVGKADFAPYAAWLRKHGIRTTYINQVPGERTATAYIITDQDDNQIAGFYPGAMLKQWKGIFKTKPKSLAIVSAQHPKDMVDIPAQLRKKGTDYIFDPGQQTTSLNKTQLRSAITGSWALIGNDYEIALVSKKTGWGMKTLLTKTTMVITTLGAKGSVIQVANQKIKIPAAKPRSTIDPTGAGDAYRAGFMQGVVEGRPLEECGRMGAVAAVYSVETQGTQTHNFTPTSFKRRYRQNFKKSL